jgi:hypothetical protein
MAPLTDQKWLVENFNIEIIQYGPQPSWPVAEWIYLQCPRCHYYVWTNDYDECACGNLSIDVGYSRISVNHKPEDTVAVCRVTPKSD